jgi:hypothetical protein
MRKILISIALLSLPGFAGDTTYSRTESVTKGGSGGESGGLPGLFRLISELHVDADCGGQSSSPPSAAYRPANLRSWPEGGWRWGLGTGMGGLLVGDQAGGIHLELDGEATFEFPGETQLRLQGGGFAGLLQPAVDHSRQVYVDGRLIGTQYDTSGIFTQSGFSIFSDFLELIGTNGGYLGAGAGAVRLRETVDFNRHEDYGPVDQAREEARWNWLPALRFVLGFYGGGLGRAFARMEFGYQATLNSPRYGSSFPTDNSPITHSFSLGFAWL